MQPDEAQALRDQLSSLLKRVARIEQRLGAIAPHPERAAETAPAPGAIPTPDTAPVGLRPLRPEPSISAGSLLGVMGVICFVLGAAFIVKLAVDSGWLTPYRQWSLVTLLGAALVGGGLALRVRDRDYSGYAAGAGVVTLFFAAYAGQLYFGVYGIEAAVGAAALVSIFCLWLLRHFAHDFFAVTAAVGTFLTPLILARDQGAYALDPLEFHAAYSLVWTACFALVASHLPSRVTSLAAAYLGLGVFSELALAQANPANYGMIIGVQALQFAILAGGVAAYSVRFRRPLREREVWLYFPVLLFFYASNYYFLARWQPSLAPWVSLGFAGLLLALHRVAGRRLALAASSGPADPLASGDAVALFACLVVYHAIYLELLSESLKPYLVPLILLGANASARRGPSVRLRWPVTVLLLVLFAGEFGRICWQLAAPAAGDLLPVGALSAALCFATYFSIRREGEEAGVGKAFLAATHLISLLSLYRLAYPHGSLAVSGAWAAYAGLVLAWAFCRRDWAFARSSLFVLLAAAGKALVYDAAQAPSGVRIICLLFTGALLYLAGLLFRRIGEREAALAQG
jgi:uncharacterized membrane protein